MNNRHERFGVMCVPGHAEDGSDSWWYVVDRRKEMCREVGCGDATREIALREVREANRG